MINILLERELLNLEFVKLEKLRWDTPWILKVWPISKHYRVLVRNAELRPYARPTESISTF